MLDIASNQITQRFAVMTTVVQKFAALNPVNLTRLDEHEIVEAATRLYGSPKGTFAPTCFSCPDKKLSCPDKKTSCPDKIVSCPDKKNKWALMSLPGFRTTSR
jgi:hypothetical protein